MADKREKALFLKAEKARKENKRIKKMRKQAEDRAADRAALGSLHQPGQGGSGTRLDINNYGRGSASITDVAVVRKRRG